MIPPSSSRRSLANEGYFYVRIAANSAAMRIFVLRNVLYTLFMFDTHLGVRLPYIELGASDY